MTSRRHFIGQSAAVASAMAFPLVGGAQPKPVKVGVIHPVTGALAYSGQQCREGVMMAIDDINKALNKAIATAEVREKFASFGLEAGGGSAADLQKTMQDDAKRWAPVVRKSGFKAD